MKILYLTTFLAILFLLQVSYAQRPVPILPAEEVFVDDDVFLKFSLVDQRGNPITDADVTASASFFKIQLFDDGKHSDGEANDGLYGNVIKANTTQGVYSVLYSFSYGNFSDTMTATLKISPRPLLSFAQLVLVLIIATVGGIGAYVLRKKIKARLDIESRIKELKARKNDLNKTIKETQISYFKRQIDEKTYVKTMSEYQNELIKVDVELRKLLGKVSKEKSRKSEENE